MDSRFISPIRAAFLALLIVPACTGNKGGGTDDTSSSSGDESTGGDETTGSSMTGVLTSTHGSTDDSTGPVTTSGTEASTGTGTTGEVSATGTTGEPEISCGEEPLYFPEFDRTCASNRDCSFVFHQIDCCGNLAALGINQDVAKEFIDAEEICVAQYPGCGCPAGPTIADDGKTEVDPNTIEVACTEGQCKTFVP